MKYIAVDPRDGRVLITNTPTSPGSSDILSTAMEAMGQEPVTENQKLERVRRDLEEQEESIVCHLINHLQSTHSGMSGPMAEAIARDAIKVVRMSSGVMYPPLPKLEAEARGRADNSERMLRKDAMDHVLSCFSGVNPVVAESIAMEALHKVRPQVGTLTARDSGIVCAKAVELAAKEFCLPPEPPEAAYLADTPEPAPEPAPEPLMKLDPATDEYGVYHLSFYPVAAPDLGLLVRSLDAEFGDKKWNRHAIVVHNFPADLYTDAHFRPSWMVPECGVLILRCNAAPDVMWPNVRVFTKTGGAVRREGDYFIQPGTEHYHIKWHRVYDGYRFQREPRWQPQNLTTMATGDAMPPRDEDSHRIGWSR